MWEVSGNWKREAALSTRSFVLRRVHTVMHTLTHYINYNSLLRSPEYIHSEGLVDGRSGRSLLLVPIVVGARTHVKLTRVNLTPCVRLRDTRIGRHFGEGEPYV